MENGKVKPQPSRAQFLSQTSQVLRLMIEKWSQIGLNFRVPSLEIRWKVLAELLYFFRDLNLVRGRSVQVGETAFKHDWVIWGNFHRSNWNRSLKYGETIAPPVLTSANWIASEGKPRERVWAKKNLMRKMLQLVVWMVLATRSVL